MRIEPSPLVDSDLESIADYIAQDNPARAVTFIREIREEIRQVGQNPLNYRLRPEYGKDARVAVIGHYVIGTTPDATYVEIVEVPAHPFFLGCQFHPEFKSKPLEPHPLFR